jgi:dephospho-CoA kinase
MFMDEIIRVGVTGPSGAGKGLFCSIMARDGRIHTIDGDEIAREVVKKGQKCLDELVAAFGREILDEKGELIRSRLSQIAFADPQKLNLLNKITHKYIKIRIEEIVASLPQTTEMVLIDGAALIEGNLKGELFKIIAVIADDEIRKTRIIKRDGISESEADLRMKAQKPARFYIDNCDFAVYNNGSLKELEEQCEKIFKKLFELKGER